MKTYETMLFGFLLASPLMFIATLQIAPIIGKILWCLWEMVK